MSGDFDVNWWIRGHSETATGKIPDSGPTEDNLKFSENWAKFKDKENEAWKKDFQVFNDMMQGPNSNPGVAIMIFLLLVGADMMTKSENSITEQSDQVTDLTNISQAIAKIKSIFESANGADPSTDAKLTAQIKADLTQLKTYLQNDKWAAGDPSTPGGSSLAQSIVPSLDNLLNVLKSPNISLGTIWKKAVITNPGDLVKMAWVTGGGGIPTSCRLTGVSQDIYNNIMKQCPDFNNHAKIVYNSQTKTLDVTALPTGGPPGNYLDNDVWLGTNFENVVKPYTVPPTDPSAAPDPTNLKIFLTAFDTMNSSATSLSNTYQGKTQYLTSSYTEVVNMLKNLEKAIEQQSSSIQRRSGS